MNTDLTVELEADIELLTTELLERQDELVALYNLAQSTSTLIDVKALLTTAARELHSIFQVEHSFALYCGDDEIQQQQVPANKLLDESLVSWLSSTRARGGDLVFSDSAVPGVRNGLVAPITINDEIVAAVGLTNRHEGAFSAPDRKRLSMIAEQIGAHLENLLLQEQRLAQVRMQSEMSMAQKVQQQLLPKSLPRVPGLDVAATSRSALDVGGDFYDFIVDDGNGVTFALGDVSGKGMAAALLMSMVRTTLRTAKRFLPDPSPADLLSEANEALYDDFTEVSRFVTLFGGEFDSQTRCLHYANAGHSPVIYCPAGGKAVMLEADGVPLGVLDDCMVDKRSLRLQEGDVLIVATDGFPEAENSKGDMYGYDKLYDLAKWGASSDKISAEHIRRSLFKTVDAFSGDTAQSDDMTVIVLKGVQ